MQKIIEELNRRGVRIAWIQTMRHPGVFVKEHGILILSADRGRCALVRVLREVLSRVRERAR